MPFVFTSGNFLNLARLMAYMFEMEPPVHRADTVLYPAYTLKSKKKNRNSNLSTLRTVRDNTRKVTKIKQNLGINSSYLPK